MQHNDDELLLDPVRRFLEEQCTLAALEAAVRPGRQQAYETLPPDEHADGSPGYGVCNNGKCNTDFYARLWSQICELGWPLLLVPQERGGIGMGMAQAVAVMELAGGALLPLPLGYWMSSMAFLARSGAQSSVAQRAEQTLNSGRLAGFALSTVDERRFVPYCLNGSPLLVLHHAGARVQARWADGTAGAPGIDPLIDSSWLEKPTWTMQDEFTCDEADWEVFEQRSRLLLAAEMLGVAARALDIATAYAQQRQQFGRPIGGFQAIKHRLAQDWMNLDNARLLIAEAATQMDAAGDACVRARGNLDSAGLAQRAHSGEAEPLPNAEARANPAGMVSAAHLEDAQRPARACLVLSLAEYATQHAANTVVRNALQVHGAMGMTWEANVHFYLKRVHFLNALINCRRTSADRLQHIWTLSATQMAGY